MQASRAVCLPCSACAVSGLHARAPQLPSLPSVPPGPLSRHTFLPPLCLLVVVYFPGMYPSCRAPCFRGSSFLGHWVWAFGTTGFYWSPGDMTGRQQVPSSFFQTPVGWVTQIDNGKCASSARDPRRMFFRRRLRVSLMTLPPMLRPVCFLILWKSHGWFCGFRAALDHDSVAFAATADDCEVRGLRPSGYRCIFRGGTASITSWIREQSRDT